MLPVPVLKTISCDPEMSIYEIITYNFSATYNKHSKRSLRVKMHWYSRFSLEKKGEGVGGEVKESVSKKGEREIK